MSKTTLYDVRADGKAHVMITGRFQGGSSAVGTLPITDPPGWTVAYTSAGTYTLTFADQYAAFVSCIASLEADTPNDIDGFTVMTSTYTTGASPTLVIETNTGTTATDIPANCYVNFMAVFRNTTVAQ